MPKTDTGLKRCGVMFCSIPPRTHLEVIHVAIRNVTKPDFLSGESFAFFKNSLLLHVRVKMIQISLFALLIVFGVFASDAVAASANTCTMKIVQHILSPDRAWNAEVVHQLCEGPYPFESDATYFVRITSRSKASNHGDVFSTDDSGHPEQQPAVSWFGHNSLLISTLLSPNDIKKDVICGSTNYLQV